MSFPASTHSALWIGGLHVHSPSMCNWTENQQIILCRWVPKPIMTEHLNERYFIRNNIGPNNEPIYRWVFHSFPKEATCLFKVKLVQLHLTAGGRGEFPSIYRGICENEIHSSTVLMKAGGDCSFTIHVIPKGAHYTGIEDSLKLVNSFKPQPPTIIW